MSDKDVPPYGTGDTSFQNAGGEEGLRRLVDRFYDAMATLPEARTIFKMHPKDIEVSKDKLALFLCGWLGGPKLFREKYGPIRIPIAHKHLPIGPKERDAWMQCMKIAVSEQTHWREDFQSYFLREIYVPAERSRNRD